MKRAVITALLLFSVALPTSVLAKKKPAPVDIKSMSKVFIGWVDVNPEDYHMQGYASKQEWIDVISNANVNFQKNLGSGSAFSGKTVTGAKDRNDANTAGNDLYIKFSDVQFDRKYRLHLAAHLIDLKTNAELGTLPLGEYGGHFCTLSGCMDKELDEVNKELQQLAGGSAK